MSELTPSQAKDEKIIDKNIADEEEAIESYASAEKQLSTEKGRARASEIKNDEKEHKEELQDLKHWEVKKSFREIYASRWQAVEDKANGVEHIEKKFSEKKGVPKVKKKKLEEKKLGTGAMAPTKVTNKDRTAREGKEADEEVTQNLEEKVNRADGIMYDPSVNIDDYDRTRGQETTGIAALLLEISELTNKLGEDTSMGIVNPESAEISDRIQELTDEITRIETDMNKRGEQKTLIEGMRAEDKLAERGPADMTTGEKLTREIAKTTRELADMYNNVPDPMEYRNSSEWIEAVMLGKESTFRKLKQEGLGPLNTFADSVRLKTEKINRLQEQLENYTKMIEVRGKNSKDPLLRNAAQVLAENRRGIHFNRFPSENIMKLFKTPEGRAALRQALLDKGFTLEDLNQKYYSYDQMEGLEGLNPLAAYNDSRDRRVAQYDKKTGAFKGYKENAGMFFGNVARDFPKGSRPHHKLDRLVPVSVVEDENGGKEYWVDYVAQIPVSAKASYEYVTDPAGFVMTDEKGNLLTREKDNTLTSTVNPRNMAAGTYNRDAGEGPKIGDLSLAPNLRHAVMTRRPTEEDLADPEVMATLQSYGPLLDNDDNPILDKNGNPVENKQVVVFKRDKFGNKIKGPDGKPIPEKRFRTDNTTVGNQRMIKVHFKHRVNPEEVDSSAAPFLYYRKNVGTKDDPQWQLVRNGTRYYSMSNHGKDAARLASFFPAHQKNVNTILRWIEEDLDAKGEYSVFNGYSENDLVILANELASMREVFGKPIELSQDITVKDADGNDVVKHLTSNYDTDMKNGVVRFDENGNVMTGADGKPAVTDFRSAPIRVMSTKQLEKAKQKVVNDQMAFMDAAMKETIEAFGIDPANFQIVGTPKWVGAVTGYGTNGTAAENVRLAHPEIRISGLDEERTKKAIEFFNRFYDNISNDPNSKYINEYDELYSDNEGAVEDYRGERAEKINYTEGRLVKKVAQAQHNFWNNLLTKNGIDPTKVRGLFKWGGLYNGDKAHPVKLKYKDENGQVTTRVCDVNFVKEVNDRVKDEVFDKFTESDKANEYLGAEERYIQKQLAEKYKEGLLNDHTDELLKVVHDSYALDNTENIDMSDVRRLWGGLSLEKVLDSYKNNPAVTEEIDKLRAEFGESPGSSDDDAFKNYMVDKNPYLVRKIVGDVFGVTVAGNYAGNNADLRRIWNMLPKAEKDALLKETSRRVSKKYPRYRQSILRDVLRLWGNTDDAEKKRRIDEFRQFEADAEAARTEEENAKRETALKRGEEIDLFNEGLEKERQLKYASKLDRIRNRAGYKILKDLGVTGIKRDDAERTRAAYETALNDSRAFRQALEAAKAERQHTYDKYKELNRKQSSWDGTLGLLDEGEEEGSGGTYINKLLQRAKGRGEVDQPRDVQEKEKLRAQRLLNTAFNENITKNNLREMYYWYTDAAERYPAASKNLTEKAENVKLLYGILRNAKKNGDMFTYLNMMGKTATNGYFDSDGKRYPGRPTSVLTIATNVLKDILIAKNNRADLEQRFKDISDINEYEDTLYNYTINPTDEAEIYDKTVTSDEGKAMVKRPAELPEGGVIVPMVSNTDVLKPGEVDTDAGVIEDPSRIRGASIDDVENYDAEKKVENTEVREEKEAEEKARKKAEAEASRKKEEEEELASTTADTVKGRQKLLKEVQSKGKGKGGKTEGPAQRNNRLRTEAEKKEEEKKKSSDTETPKGETPKGKKKEEKKEQAYFGDDDTPATVSHEEEFTVTPVGGETIIDSEKKEACARSWNGRMVYADPSVITTPFRKITMDKGPLRDETALDPETKKRLEGAAQRLKTAKQRSEQPVQWPDLKRNIPSGLKSKYKYLMNVGRDGPTGRKDYALNPGDIDTYAMDVLAGNRPLNDFQKNLTKFFQMWEDRDPSGFTDYLYWVANLRNDPNGAMNATYGSPLQYFAQKEYGFTPYDKLNVGVAMLLMRKHPILDGYVDTIATSKGIPTKVKRTAELLKTIQAKEKDQRDLDNANHEVEHATATIRRLENDEPMTMGEINEDWEKKKESEKQEWDEWIKQHSVDREQARVQRHNDFIDKLRYYQMKPNERTEEPLLLAPPVSPEDVPEKPKKIKYEELEPHKQKMYDDANAKYLNALETIDRFSQDEFSPSAQNAWRTYNAFKTDVELPPLRHKTGNLIIDALLQHYWVPRTRPKDEKAMVEATKKEVEDVKNNAPLTARGKLHEANANLESDPDTVTNKKLAQEAADRAKNTKVLSSKTGNGEKKGGRYKTPNGHVTELKEMKFDPNAEEDLSL